jgi:hypothetical protein
MKRQSRSATVRNRNLLALRAEKANLDDAIRAIERLGRIRARRTELIPISEKTPASGRLMSVGERLNLDLVTDLPGTAPSRRYSGTRVT